MLNLKNFSLYHGTGELFHLLCFFLIILVIAVTLVSLSFFFSKKYQDAEKLSVFESGFQPFGTSRQLFPIKFYLVSILFILFDLEVIFLFSWSISFIKLVFYSLFFTVNVFAVIVSFFFILIVGLLYELVNDSLTWV